MSRIDMKKKAEDAVGKPAPFGPDIDLGAYSTRAVGHGKVAGLRELPAEVRDQALSVGVDTGEECRRGSFFQMDHSVVFSAAYQSGLEVMDINAALAKYDWLREYWWKALTADADKYTAQAELKPHHGYFLRALPGAKAEFPLQACLYMTQEGLAQNVHNIIIAEEGSELHIITGCTVAPRVRSGLHIGISEFYVRKNARLTFTMIHNWAPDVVVRPRSAAIIEENGVFLSNYICMKPVKTLQAYPTAYCVGENATARFNSILLAPEGTNIDVGARVFLRAKGSRAEAVSKAITTGGNVVARGHFIGEAEGIKAHLECRGLILAEGGKIHAIPELEGSARDVEMTHEAAVGKIAPEEIEYLMARGLTGEEATAAIVRGFLDIEMKGVPESIGDEIKRALRAEKIAGGF
jgi:Fe-S cluster assembly scaffold protein SufB